MILDMNSILAPFLCPGCELPCWEGVCTYCNHAIQQNDSILPSPIDGIEGVAPLLFAFQSTHSILKAWKEKQGSHLEQLLFRIDPVLLNELLKLEIDLIIPVPQHFKRSWKRGHSSSLAVARFFSRKLSVPTLELLSLVRGHHPKQASLDQWNRNYSSNPFLLDSKHQPTLQFLAQNAKILLVDDLITSGNTLAKAQERIRDYFSRSQIWAAGLGYKPKKIGQGSNS